MAKKKTETERPTLVYHGEFGDTQVILKSDTYKFRRGKAHGFNRGMGAPLFKNMTRTARRIA